MSKAKSIFAKLKASQAFEPQICPIIINGDNGAEGKHAFANLIVYSSTCIIRQGNFNKKQESSACHAVTQTYSSNLVIINQSCFVRHQMVCSDCPQTRSTSHRLCLRYIDRHLLGCGFIKSTCLQNQLLQRRLKKRRKQRVRTLS